MFRPFLKVQMWFYVAGARDCAPCQKCAMRMVLKQFRYNDHDATHTIIYYLPLRLRYSYSCSYNYNCSYHYIALH